MNIHILPLLRLLHSTSACWVTHVTKNISDKDFTCILSWFPPQKNHSILTTSYSWPKLRTHSTFEGLKLWKLRNFEQNRHTKNPTTKCSPAEVLYGWPLSIKLPSTFHCPELKNWSRTMWFWYAREKKESYITSPQPYKDTRVKETAEKRKHLSQDKDHTHPTIPGDGREYDKSGGGCTDSLNPQPYPEVRRRYPERHKSLNLFISLEPIQCFKYMHNMFIWQKQQRQQADRENENFKTQQEGWVVCTYGPRRSEMQRNCTWLTFNNPIYSCGDWLVGSKEAWPQTSDRTPLH